MPNIVLYTHDISPPCRAVLMTANALGLDLTLRTINLREKEQLNPEFLKLNPQHTIPTMDDNGFILWDSHAIMTYLVTKYGKDDSLYPKDPQKRAIVDQRLHFEGGSLFSVLKTVCKPIFMGLTKSIPEEHLALIDEVLEFTEQYLKDKAFLAGNTYTLADISAAPTVECFTITRSFDKYPKVKAWLKRCEEQLPGFETCNKPGAAIFQQTIGGALGKCSL